MTTLAPFTFTGLTVRVLTDGAGSPWFVAGDVCAALDIANPRDAVVRLADDEKGVGTADTPGGPQLLTTVSEAGLYRLIFTSRKDGAETFRRWVTHEVLPAIRQTGAYVAPQTQRERARALALAVIAESDRADQAESLVAELAPRAQVAAQLLDASSDLAVADAAKVLTRAGIDVGAGRLFAHLEALGWIYRQAGDRHWRVYQRSITAGRMSVLARSHKHPHSGEVVLDAPQPRVTPKGVGQLLELLQATPAAASNRAESKAPRASSPSPAAPVGQATPALSGVGRPLAMRAAVDAGGPDSATERTT